MNSTASSPWVVLKFGGTSVSSVANWKNIAAVLRLRLAEGVKPVIVHSALSKITDRLEALLAGALRGDFESSMAEIEKRHRELARDMGIPVPPGVERHLSEIRQIAAGLALVGEISDRVRARVMSTGELMATELGAAFLNAEGIATTLVDARTLLRALERKGATEKASTLSATCRFDPDAAVQRRLNDAGGVILTQGFIASDGEGNTVLLGRGGSDTSGAYIAGLLAARRLEIWTDVPGMFSANPRDVPTARLLKSLHYDEAQEIASNGAKVLHPRCILPVRQLGIPLYVYATQTPEYPGTVITAQPADTGARVKAIALKKGITLVSMESPGMWHQVGFLADAFQIFKNHGLSVDLVSTSETNVTVSLDPAANTLDAAAVDALIGDLSQLCRAEVIGPCASLSLVGRNIRAILHELGGALELFEEQKIYLVSQAANDLNFTLVLDEDQGDRLVTQLHDLLIRANAVDPVMGPTWEQLYAPQREVADRVAWWHRRRGDLLALMTGRDSAYVYDGASIDQASAELRALSAVSRVFYAMKANPHAGVLRRVVAAGLGIECVSRGEIEHALASVPGLAADSLLFTPNFAPRAEYDWALRQGVRVTVDNLYVLKEWPALFRDREILVRVDTGRGHGHHQHVRTAGVHAKFGVPLFEMDELIRAAGAAGARIIGLHAHTGSGVFDVETWVDTAKALAAVARGLPEVRILDIGGGIGVPERAAQPAVDLGVLNHGLERFSAAEPRFELWLEPGRYVVAPAGVLLARVTQMKGKGEVQYLGVATGMNSLIRPALYGAYHEIVNLSRLEQPADQVFNVVGPICESADLLGHDRLLPQTAEGDVLLIANAGAYGRAMSSHYNLRAPAEEILI